MELIGSLTSPYVRRVRIMAIEHGQAFEFTNSKTEAGDVRLLDTNPLWRVPTAVFDGQPLFDSRAIVERIVANAAKSLRWSTTEDVWSGRNALEVVDGALDSAINVFYLRMDGVSADAGYLAKQEARVKSAMDWLDLFLASYKEDPASAEPSVLAVALQSCFDWMVFRKAYDVSAHPNCTAFREAWGKRPSFVDTHPPA